MKRLLAPLLACLALLPTTTSCGLNLIPVEQDSVLGAEAYPQLLAEERVITSGSELRTVERMTARLVEAAKIESPDVANLFDWEVKLVRRDDLVNAWCLPGGKMAVYTGILPVAADPSGDFETGLAVVMGHEIAHATLRHGTQKMTSQMGASAIINIVSMALGGDSGNLAGLVGGFVANFAGLKFGRDMELEADRRGLLYMARAGYDPRAAVGFWQRMAQASAGAQRPPEWLSTHPTNERRIQQIQAILPEVLPIYQQSRGSGGLKSIDPNRL